VPEIDAAVERTALRFDVTEVVGASSAQSVATWLFVPPADRIGPHTRLAVCLPGGTYDKRYYHLAIPGHPGYSMAEHLASAGHVVLSVDHWAVGDSTRPERAADVTPEAVSAANHAVTTQALDRLRDGTLTPALAALPDAVSIGVGHSMGSMLTVLQQAAHRSHAQLAILGKSMVYIDRTHFGADKHPEETNRGDYVWGDRENLRRVFYWEDVPEEVIAADTAAQVPVPTLLAARTLSADVCTQAAAAIDVPVFLGIGERDTVAAPRDEPRYYGACPDITLYVLPRSAHCHNFASTRAQLWDRLLRWIPAVD
jgi:alpha-beta hydrolase superfamily lysophospholipase